LNSALILFGFLGGEVKLGGNYFSNVELCRTESTLRR